MDQHSCCKDLGKLTARLCGASSGSRQRVLFSRGAQPGGPVGQMCGMEPIGGVGSGPTTFLHTKIDAWSCRLLPTMCWD